MSNIKIETLVKWSEPKKVNTKNGPRNLRTGDIGNSFWNAWKSDKDALKSAGVSVGKNQNGEWEACWWLPIDAAEQTKINDAQSASRAVDADIDLPVPHGLAYLPFQKAGVAYALARSNTLIADSMGLGKTIQAIAVFNASPEIRKVLVLCPASLRLNWKKEFQKWTTRPIEIAVISGGKPSDWPAWINDDPRPDGNNIVIIINYDILAKHRERLNGLNIDLLIGDEIHFCKNQTAARTKAVFGLRDRKGNVKQLPIVARKKIFLTGTPIVNRPIELWPLVESLDPTDLGRSFFGFAKRYCNARQTKWGWDFTGSANLSELQNRLREKFMVRRLKEDVLLDLPAKRRQVIEIPANGAGRAVSEERRIFDSHQALIEDLEIRIREAEFAQTHDLELDDVENLRKQLSHARSIAFTEMSKARHETALAKVPHVIEHLKNALEEGPVVLFAHHRDVIDQIKSEFPNASTLTGETSMENRQKAVDDFQAARTDLFIGNIQAAGVGITLTRSAHVIFAELDWVPGNLSQAEDRCHRIGQTNTVLVQHLVLEDSVDSIMSRKLIAKQEVIDKALDQKTEAKPINSGSIIDEVEIELKPDRVAEEAAKITPEQSAAIHQGLKILAARCDGAHDLDGAGFNKFDTNIGKSLAARQTLSTRQAVLGKKLVNKYRGQLPADLVSIATVKEIR